MPPPGLSSGPSAPPGGECPGECLWCICSELKTFVVYWVVVIHRQGREVSRLSHAPLSRAAGVRSGHVPHPFEGSDSAAAGGLGPGRVTASETQVLFSGRDAAIADSFFCPGLLSMILVSRPGCALTVTVGSGYPIELSIIVTPSAESVHF